MEPLGIDFESLLGGKIEPKIDAKSDLAKPQKLLKNMQFLKVFEFPGCFKID